MGVGQWTSLLMTHEFRTTPSKLDCAFPTLHLKDSHARGAIIRGGRGWAMGSTVGLICGAWAWQAVEE